MNILTKLFVGLLSLLVLPLVAGFVVYVMKTEEFAARITQLEQTANREKDIAIRAQQEAIAARGERDLRIAESSARVEGYRQAAESALAREKTAETAKAVAEGQRDQSEAKYTAVQAEVKAWADKIPALEKEKTELKTQMLAGQNEVFKLTQRLFELEQTKAGYAATIKRMQETIAALELAKDQLITASKAGVRSNTAGGTETLASLRGVIRARRNIAGIEYATISLGSADSVTKGMRFRVVDQNSFLGYLTIDAVEPNEAVGHLQPRDAAALQQIVKDTVVISQF